MSAFAVEDSMTYSFDRIVSRRANNSEKWCFDMMPSRLGADQRAPIPMWIADMDFPTAPPILEALQQTVSNGVFGYSFVTDSYREAVVQWHERRFHWDVNPDWLIQTAGVVAALSQIVKAFTSPGDAVLVQTPVYARLQKLCLANKRRVVNAPLCELDRSYAFDTRAFEAVILRERPKLFILCNPHNPIGKVWTVDELQAIGEICLRHHLLVVSDEVHADLIINQNCQHVPFARIDPAFAQRSITCTSPSKAFNLAGLQVSNIVIPDAISRARLFHEIEANGSLNVNTLGLVACEAAYRFGEPWLNELLQYLRDNHRLFSDAVKSLMPELRLFAADALYLGWLDCRGLGFTDSELERFMLHDAGVWFVSGSSYGVGGEGFMRVNLACPRHLLNSAIERMALSLRRLRAM
jgi:cysteine-S-conjugate beta-lyase